jgi:hypothetical protein
VCQERGTNMIRLRWKYYEDQYVPLLFLYMVVQLVSTWSWWSCPYYHHLNRRTVVTYNSVACDVHVVEAAYTYTLQGNHHHHMYTSGSRTLLFPKTPAIWQGPRRNLGYIRKNRISLGLSFVTNNNNYYNNNNRLELQKNYPHSQLQPGDSNVALDSWVGTNNTTATTNNSSAVPFRDDLLKNVDQLLWWLSYDNDTTIIDPTTTTATATASSSSSSKIDQDIIQRIDEQHGQDCSMAVHHSPLVMEQPSSLERWHDEEPNIHPQFPQPATVARVHAPPTTTIPPYEWVALQQERIGTDNEHEDDGGTHHRIVQSKEPILNTTTIQYIRQAAQELWQQGNLSSRFTYQSVSNYEVHVSDFDQQNSTRHVLAHINDALNNKIYPLLRQTLVPSFRDTKKPAKALDGDVLYVYDALVIRYNATAAAATTTTVTTTTKNTTIAVTAGQPLHRDYGLATVNIMLNDPTEYSYGGGTFFENQLSIIMTQDNRADGTTTVNQPLQPYGVGHGLLHLASERHAGAGITYGIRDILVLFITSTAGSLCSIPSSNCYDDSTTNATVTKTTCISNMTMTTNRSKNRMDQAEQFWIPPSNGLSLVHPYRNIIRNTILKQCRAYCETQYSGGGSSSSTNPALDVLHCRIRHQRLAVCMDPNDGEAYQYLGTALMNYAQYCYQQHPERLIQRDDRHHHSWYSSDTTTTMVPQPALVWAIRCFQYAATLTPCDYRVYNNLAIALRRYCDGLVGTSSPPPPNAGMVVQEIDTAYVRALHLLEQTATIMGGEFTIHEVWDSITLNYGLELANRNLFVNASNILHRIVVKYPSHVNDRPTTTTTQHDRIRSDAYQLWKFCTSQLNNEQLQGS